MAHKGSEVYDDEAFFSQYIAKRRRGNSPNELLEEPIIDAFLGGIKNKELLDLGCGDAAYGRKLLESGLKSYHGIDGSTNMISLAQQSLSGLTQARLEVKEIEGLNLPAECYDIVLSRLVLHYIEQLEAVFTAVKTCLRKEGCFIFSVEHPIITSNYESYHQQTKVRRQNWVVDNYFFSGQRVNQWIGKEVIKYHRTLDEYIQLIKATGFEIEEIRESKPEREHFLDISEYERRMRIPLFLLFKLRKKP